MLDFIIFGAVFAILLPVLFVPSFWVYYWCEEKFEKLKIGVFFSSLLSILSFSVSALVLILISDFLFYLTGFSLLGYLIEGIALTLNWLTITTPIIAFGGVVAFGKDRLNIGDVSSILLGVLAFVGLIFVWCGLYFLTGFPFWLSWFL